LKVPAPERHPTTSGVETVVESNGILAVVERCRARDESAWKELYDAHFDFVLRVARRLGTPESEAEDVVHDVFVIVHRKLDRFEGGRLTTWLYRITANVVSERHRKRRVRHAFESLKVWIGGEPGESPERTAERSSATRAVERVLERMNPKKREVFALFELEGLSGDEIAERIGCPVNTVWTRLYHARKQFLEIAKRLRVLDEVKTR
jgi:RNA polymerase sigma-70 factor (ECF subfamily)